MSQLAIRLENVSKRYRIGAAANAGRNFKEVLTDALAAPLRRFQRRTEELPDATTLWAVKDVSFEIQPGEVVGLIGRNGSGKSTLLKILSRITEPTEGCGEIRGRVASLLEVGTGFHPELTGRENIYLNGAILGMTRREMQRKYDEIVAFSEVERFIDTPVKWYSTGMYLRLAFAVAAHLEPEVLLVDEVLAVGDAAFQKKCLGKMGQVAKEGRTIFFVSHNMAAVRALCDRALLMNSGRLALDSKTEAAVSTYLAEGEMSGASVEWDAQHAPRSPELRFIKAAILNDRGEPASLLDCRKAFVIAVEYEVLRDLPGLRIGFFIQRQDGVEVCGSNDPDAWSESTRRSGVYRSQCTFPGYVLNAGTYSVCFGSDTPPYETPLVATPFCLSFTIEDVEGHGSMHEKLPGLVRPNLRWEVCRVPVMCGSTAPTF